MNNNMDNNKNNNNKNNNKKKNNKNNEIADLLYYKNFNFLIIIKKNRNLKHVKK
jgi:hypothetical protein